MILFQINVPSVAVRKFERNAPRAVDMDRVSSWLKTSQRMEVKPWQVHFFYAFYLFKSVKTQIYSSLQRWLNLA
jgi:hypothetical protein